MRLPVAGSPPALPTTLHESTAQANSSPRKR